MKDHPALSATPLAKRRDFKTKCVPISLHSDGVPVSGIGRAWSRSVSVYSWQSMIGRGSTLDICFLTFMIFHSLMVKIAGEDTFTKFSKKLAWSLKWLAKGQWPTEDENGIPLAGGGGLLAGGFYACLWAVRADLADMSKTYGFNHVSSKEPCSCCGATTSDDKHPWTDGRPTATWLSTIWTPQGWIEHHPDRHPIFQLLGVAIANFVPDLMHTLHLGVYQWIFGSVLKMLTHLIMTGPPAENLEVLVCMIKERYQELGIKERYNDIRTSMYDRGDAQFPRLKGQAAEIKHVVSVLEAVFKELMDRSCRQHKQVELLLGFCHNIESILDKYADCYRLPADAAESFNTSCWSIFQLTTSLAQFYHAQSIMLFNLTIKFHYMLHLGLMSRYINPRRTWCYVGEDFMKKVKHLTQASHSGTSPVLVVSKVVRKYILGLGMNMTDFTLAVR